MTKNYIKGNVKQRKTQFGEIFSLRLKFEDLEKLPRNKGYIKLTMAKRKERDEYGNSHYVYEDDYVPNANQETQVIDEVFDDLPFGD